MSELEVKRIYTISALVSLAGLVYMIVYGWFFNGALSETLNWILSGITLLTILITQNLHNKLHNHKKNEEKKS